MVLIHILNANNNLFVIKLHYSKPFKSYFAYSPMTLNFKPSKYADFMQSAKVKTPKYKFYVEIGGDPNAPVILLIMGLGAQFLVWSNEFCERLIQAGFRVIRFDNRDIGKSSKIKHKNTLTRKLTERQAIRSQLHLIGRYKFGLPLPEVTVPYDLFDMAEDVYQLMQVLQIRQYHILGMSMGGMIAQILAVRYPHQVLRLGLLSTSNNRRFSMPPAFSSLKVLLKPTPAKDDEQAVTQHMLQTIKAIASPQYFDERHTQQKVQLLYQRKFYPKGSQRQLLAVLATGSLVEISKAIHQPTLVVHGSQDRLIPTSHGKSLAKNIPNAQFILVDGLGHDIPLALVDSIADVFIQHFNQSL